MMILRRIADGLRRQDWTTVFIELLVVVVGLLLGLELNNWSNDLKDRRLAEAYYEQLILDLEADVATGERAVRTADINVEMGQLVYRAATQGNLEGIGDADLVLSLVTAGFTERPLITRHTYDELISTGSLRLIKNAEIKRALSSYYSRSAYSRQWDELIQHEQTRYRDAIRGVLTPEQMRWVRENLGGATGQPPDFDRTRFLRSLSERPEIIGAVASMAAEQARLRRSGEDVAEYASALIEILSN
jgi:hypothetical protein